MFNGLDHDINGYDVGPGSKSSRHRMAPQTTSLGTRSPLVGNTVLIGSGNKANGQGYVYVFTRTGTTWLFRRSSLPRTERAGDCFGCALALRGGTALIGANYRLTGRVGRTYSLAREHVATGPRVRGASGSAEQFGFSVALSTSGTTAVVGAFAFPKLDGERDGASVRVYVERQHLDQQTCSRAWASGAKLGYSVAVDGKLRSSEPRPSAAYDIHEQLRVWSQQGILTGSSSAYFGYSVALSGVHGRSSALSRGRKYRAAYVYTSAADLVQQAPPLAPAPGLTRDVLSDTRSPELHCRGHWRFERSQHPAQSICLAPPPRPPAPALGLPGDWPLASTPRDRVLVDCSPKQVAD